VCLFRHLRNCNSCVSENIYSVENNYIPSLAMTTILDTRAHSSRNSSTHVLTFSERNETTASVVSYMIRFDGRITVLVPADFPMGCCTYFNFTEVTTYNPTCQPAGELRNGSQTCAFFSDHQFRGITRIFGIAASAAGAPDRISFD
jgi:hypothetical protein